MCVLLIIMEHSQLIFFDTEFTNFEAPQLISIGLAADTGETFYCECPFDRRSASNFVLDVVVPLLSGDSEVTCPYEKLFERLLMWFNVVSTGRPVLLCCDSTHDEHLFRQVFDGYPPRFIEFANVESCTNEFLRHQFFCESHLPEHHALNDALALRFSFRRALARNF